MNIPNLNQHTLYVGQILVARENLICDNSAYGMTAILQKFLTIDRDFLTLKKELKKEQGNIAPMNM